MWLPIIVIVGLFGAFKGSQKFESEESKNQHLMYEARLAAREDSAVEQCVAMDRMQMDMAKKLNDDRTSIQRIPIQKF